MDQTLVLYHGTDVESAHIIKEEGFKSFHNPEHWLGNGIYFYLDKNLAEWWTSNPTSKYGKKIFEPAIITCQLTHSSDKICDMRQLSWYRWVIEQYVSYREVFYKYYNTDEIELNEFRCLFFDFLMESRKCDIVIGNFYLPEQPYLYNPQEGDFAKLCLCYTETQVCVSTRLASSIVNLE